MDNILNYSTYNLEAYMTPIWKNNIVYNESIMFVPNSVTREIEPAPLLYAPDKVLAVQSSDYSTKYQEEIDYIVENNCIRITKNSSIPIWKYDEYYLLQPDTIPIQSASAKERYVKVANGREFSKMQLAVTYSHKCKWNGIKPKYEEEKLARTIAKLKSKELLTILYYGDSIIEGCEASGRNLIKPGMPIFTAMVTEQLKKSYAYENINEKNTAVGGTNSEWGKDNVRMKVAIHKPDLVVIGFGMNDSGGNISVEAYEQNIRDIIKTVRANNDSSEFVLVSSSIPNPDCIGWTYLQADYKNSLEHIEKDTVGVAIAPMTQMHEYLLAKKRYDDMNGNGVNHPNDFLARVYAQTVSQCLIENL